MLHDGKPQSVGESQLSHNLYPLRAKLIEREPLTVVSQRVDMRGRTLGWLISRLDQGRSYFLMGEIELNSDKIKPVTNLEHYKPAVYRGNVLVLHYAKAADLTPWQNLVAAQGEIYVQFWLKPGDPAIVFTPGEERPVDLIPEMLKPYL